MLSTNYQLRFNFLFCAVNCFIISDAFYFINVLSKTDLENFKIFYGISFIALSQKYHCNTASAWLQPHSWIDPQVMWKVLFLGFFLNKPQLFGQKVHFLRDFLNWPPPKNPFWKIEPWGCNQAEMVYYSMKLLS